MAFLDPGPAIVARLLQQTWPLPVPVEVGTAVDAGAVLDAPQTHPTAWVIFDGWGPTQDLAGGAIQQIRQRWSVVLKMRKSSGSVIGSAAPLGDELAAVVDVVHAALCGWRPCQGFDPLALGEGTGATYTAGYIYYQIEFTTRTVVRGVP